MSKSAMDAVRAYAKSMGVELTGDEESTVLDVPVRPLALPAPLPRVEPELLPGNPTALLYGDSHFPNQDEPTLEIVAQVAAELNPGMVVHMGDLLDCYSLSRFDKNPERIETIQDEINSARLHLATMRHITPTAAMVLLEGNHEDRLRRTLWNLPQPYAAILKLDIIKNNLTWPKLLGVEELGITFVPYDHTQAKSNFLPKFILKHGNKVRKFSAYTAKAELERYGRSGASGHTHRLGVHYHDDHNGAHVWVETGCTCSLTPEYMQDPDWQNGCVVLTFDPETGAVAPETVEIRNGLGVWRGRKFRSSIFRG